MEDLKILKQYKLKAAFSLIELMISLIVVSCITAAFTPVITKKLKSGSLIAGSVGDAFRNSKMGLEDCKEYTGIDNCMFCDVKKKECKICAGSACDISHQYTVSKNCTCGECATLFNNCQKCTESKCEKCKDGKFQQGSECVDCPSGKICDGTSKTPQNPQSGYYAKDGIPFECSLAIENCKECSATKSGDNTVVICSKCLKNTYLKSDNKQCVNCNTTQYCPEGTSQSGIKSCSQLTTNCTECNADNCTRCSNYLKLSSNKCVNCDNGYTCDGTSTQTQCNTSGYYCTNGQSYACSAKTGNTNCIDCDRATGICTKCTLGTHKLTSSNTCTTCDTGYWCSNGISKDNSNCTTGCKVCANSTTCTTCNTGYYKDSNNHCQTCPSGYWCANGEKYSCSAGTWSISSVNNTTSSACTSSTLPEGKWCNNGLCSSCGDGCKVCASASSCSNCNSGYWYSSNSCNPCPDNATCSGGTNSFTCNTDYEKSGTSCKLKCQVANCDSSSCSNKTTCTKCNNGYWLNNNTCAKCTGTYVSCNGTSTMSCTKSGWTATSPTSACVQCSSPWSLACWNGKCGCGIYRQGEWVRYNQGCVCSWIRDMGGTVSTTYNWEYSSSWTGSTCSDRVDEGTYPSCRILM